MSTKEDIKKKLLEGLRNKQASEEKNEEEKKSPTYSSAVARAKSRAVSKLNQKRAQYYENQLKEYQAKLDYYNSFKKNADWEEKSKISALDDLNRLDNTQLYWDNVMSDIPMDPTATRYYDKIMRLQQASPDETAMFNYLYNTDKKAAWKYYDEIESGLSQKALEKMKSDYKELAQKSKIGASLMSVGTNFISIKDGFENLTEGTMNLIAGNGFTFDTGDDYVTHATNSFREGASADMNAVGKFFYGVGMSMLDNIARAPFGGVGAGLLAMGQAASHAIVQGKEMGMEDWKAALYGITVGSIEGLTEKYSVDKLLDKTNLAKNIGGYILKNVVAEGSEEAASELGDQLAQLALAGDEAEWRKEYEVYRSKGYSKAEAIGLVIANTAGDLGLAFLSGAISGGGMAGGSATINYAATAPGYISKGMDISAGANATADLLAFAEAAKSKTIDNTARKMANAKTELGRNYYRGKLSEQVMNEAYDRLHPYGDETATKSNGKLTHDAKVAQKKLVKENKKRTANGQQTIADEFEQSEFAQKKNAYEKKLKEYEKGKLAADRTAVEGLTNYEQSRDYNVSKDGKTYLIENDENGEKSLKETEITELVGIEDGVARVKLSDGSVVSTKEVALPTDAVTLYKEAAGYNDLSYAKAFLDGYSSYEGTAEAYAEEAKTAYLLGREAGTRGIEEMIKTLPKAKQKSIIKNPATAAAFEAGKARATKLSEDSAKMKKVREAKKSRAEEQSKSRDNIFESLDTYDFEEIASIKRDSQNKIADSYEDVVLFIRSSVEGKTRGRLFIGKLKSETSNKIKKDTNISTDGYSVILTSDEIKHIFKQHGDSKKEGPRGQESITFDNISNVLEAILNPDTVSVETDSNSVVSLIFKKTNNGVITAVTIASVKKKALTLKSARITKKKQHISPPSDVQASNPTSKNELSMNTVSTDSISEKSEKVNTSDEKNSSERGKKIKKKSEGSFAVSESVDMNNLTATQKAAIKRMRILSKCLGGINIVVTDEGFDKNSGLYRSENGKYDPNTNTITISINAGKQSVNGFCDYAIVETLSHEVTHFVKEHSSEDYESLKLFLQKNVYTASQWGTLVRGRLEQYRTDNSKFTYEAAEEEVVANGCQTMLNSPRVLAALAKGNYSLFERIKFRVADFLDGIIEKLTNNVYHTSEARLVLMSTEKTQRELEKKFIEAVRNARSDTKSRDTLTENSEKSNSFSKKSSEKFSKREGIDENELMRYNENAVNEFGTTTDYAKAGFVLSDGRMLDLSQYGQRGVQHRIIERFYDDVKGDDAIARFINEGNVRIKESSPGIEISSDTELTVSQLNAISRFISSSIRSRGVFYLDITDPSGNDVASVTYNSRDSAERVVLDIKDYYKYGDLPDSRGYAYSKRETIDRREDIYGEEQQERSETVYSGRAGSTYAEPKTTRGEAENRPRIQETVGETNEAYSSDRTYRRLDVVSDPFKNSDFIIPKNGSALYRIQHELTEEYGIECHIVKESSWNRENPATIYLKKIYIAENIDTELLATVVSHESTHGMRQSGFKPYLDFINRTSEMIDMRLLECRDFMDDIAEHVGIDIFDMNDIDFSRFYDEFNATVYGFFKAGIIENKAYDYDWLPDAFYDFNAYIDELSSIHEQFKEYQRQSQANVSNIKDQKQSKREQITVSTRDMILDSLATEGLNTNELRSVNAYRNRISRINELVEERSRVEIELIEIINQKGSEAASRRSELRVKKNNLTQRITREENLLYEQEKTKYIRKVATDVMVKRIEAAVENGEMPEVARYSKEITTLFENRIASLRKSEEDKRVRERVKEYKAKQKEKRNVRDLKQKIKKLYNKFYDMLHNPTDKRYVPTRLAKPMCDILALLDFDTGYFERTGRGEKAKRKRESMREFLRELSENLSQIVSNDVRVRGDDLPDEDYDMLSMAFQKYMVEDITELASQFGENATVADFDEAELSAVYQVLKRIDDTITDSRKLISLGEYADAIDAANSIVEEQNQISKRHKSNKVLSAIDKLVSTNALDVMDNVRIICDHNEDSVLYKLFEALNEGRKRERDLKMQIFKELEKVTVGEPRVRSERKSNSKSLEAAHKPMPFECRNAKGDRITVEMTEMQIISALLTIKSEETNPETKHIFNEDGNGVLLIADANLSKKGLESKAAQNTTEIHISKSDVAKLEGMLSEWGKGYMRAVVSSLSMIGDAVNKTALEAKGYPLATMDDYYPFIIDKDYLVREISNSDVLSETVNTYGPTHSRAPGANQPLIILGADTVLKRHLDKMSKFVGLCSPVQDFNRIWNSTVVDSSGRRVLLKRHLKNLYGDSRVQVLEQAVKDMQANRSDSNPDNIVSAAGKALADNFAPAVLMANVQSMLKQPSAIYSAMTVIGHRSTVAVNAARIKALNGMRSGEIFDKIDRYTSALWERRQGLSTRELGDIATQIDPSFLRRITKKWVPEIIKGENWLLTMDVMNACSIWILIEDQVEKSGEYESESEEYYKAVTRLFEKTMEKTQVTYDALHRCELMKTTNQVVRGVLMFQNETFKQFGQIYMAFRGVASAYYSGDAARVASAWRKLGKTVFAMLRTLWSLLLFTLGAKVLMRKREFFEDEDEDVTVESVIKASAFEFDGNAAGYALPFLGTVAFDFIESWVTGSRSFDAFSIPSVDAANDFINCAKSLVKGNLTFKKIENFAFTAVETVQGVPITNIKNNIKALIEWIMSLFE